MGLSLFLVTCLIIFANLWKQTGAAKEIFTPIQLLWYIALNEWVLISLPEIQDTMEEDLQSGKLSYLLPRPISYLGSVFFEALGILVVNLIVLGVISFSFTFWMTEGFPFSLAVLPVTLFLGLFAGILGVLLQMIVGLSAFWLRDIGPFYWILEKLLFAFGGLLIPLSLYPKILQKIAYFTPFPLILGGRSALALNGGIFETVCLTASLFLWILMTTLILTLIYRKGLKIVTIEGG